MKFVSSKVFDGFSTCFRQWKADGTHCRFVHGYGTSFKVWFEGDLDERNWVFDYGGMKRAKGAIDGMNPNDYFKWLLDHTMVVAADDPHLSKFVELNDLGIIQLRVVPHVGCERFAEFLFKKIDDFVKLETNGRVRVKKLEFREHDKNSSEVTR